MASTDRRLGLSGGVAFKAPCRAATTANITLNGLQTIDGVSLAQDDRVLVKDQSTASQNGIWTVDSGDWTRALDFNGARDVVQGSLVLVVAGTINASTVYQLTTASPVIGTSSLAFAVTGAAALFYASAFMQTLLDDATAAAARATLDVRSVAESVPATLTTAGDILSHDGSVYLRLPRGDTDQYLGVTGTALTWKDLIIDLATSQVMGVLPRANGGFTPAQAFAVASLTSMASAATWYTGPTRTLGTGVWAVWCRMAVGSSGGGDNIDTRITADGSTGLVTGRFVTSSVGGGYLGTDTIFGIVTDPSGDVRGQAKAGSRTDNSIVASSSLMAIRIG